MPNPQKSGAWSALVKSEAIFFDQSSISDYGRGSHRYIWLVIRGDKLTENGLLGQKVSFFQFQPFSEEHDRIGEAAISSNYQTREGTRIPNNALIIIRNIIKLAKKVYGQANIPKKAVSIVEITPKNDPTVSFVQLIDID